MLLMRQHASVWGTLVIARKHNNLDSNHSCSSSIWQNMYINLSGCMMLQQSLWILEPCRSKGLQILIVEAACINMITTHRYVLNVHFVTRDPCTSFGNQTWWADDSFTHPQWQPVLESIFQYIPNFPAKRWRIQLLILCFRFMWVWYHNGIWWTCLRKAYAQQGILIPRLPCWVLWEFYYWQIQSYCCPCYK